MALNDYRTALDEALDTAYQVPETEEARETFRINDLDQAGWAVRKYARIERRRAELRQAAELEITRIQSWLKGEEEKIDQQESFFANLLADYHRRILEADPKAKTITLPHGTLQMRAQQPEFRRDDNALMAWIKSEPSLAERFIRTKEEVAWVDLKRDLKVSEDGTVVTAWGEIVPGVVAEIRLPQFSIKLNDGGEQ